ncbi:MAG TPA: alpha-galactosidase [Candidatus Scybalocola faecigallinarum]|uniref:Alpha-galactosidase n=1 Tax=Candidatus Scybalocola faecigallinarum TaxID=2840941 RepID=A0A9D1JQ80_9FIRM|nr:alpha-galactosidase [Candidatus Scybalocola faecigallinarum]
MGIQYDKDAGIFQIDTRSTTYLIGIADGKYVGHIYYGKKIGDCRGAQRLMRTGEHPFVPSENLREKCRFMDNFPWEYAGWGTGDYRESSIQVRTMEGYSACELYYDSYEILREKTGLKGLPATFAKEEGTAWTLNIICRDKCIGLKVILSYSIFDDNDGIMRSVRLVNEGDAPLYIDRVLSASWDMDNEAFEMLSLTGAWARERHMTRCPVTYGRHVISSIRGESSHQENPFMALLTPGTDQEKGQVYAMNFIYSGNFLAVAQASQYDSVRMAMGIHPEGFCWKLMPGEDFQAPEVVCVYSDEGLGKMTRTFHDLYREHLIRSPYVHKDRPVLINNWEATYFNFNTEKLVDIAKEAKACGIEMLVMDDGWFGKRNDDNSSLGDWTVNEEKLPGGLKNLVDQVKAQGLKFGIWVEPEMVSPDSDLYRAHPDWAIQIPGRAPGLMRAQLVLDLSRPEVVEYVWESISAVLNSADISYVKWDMNRQLCDLGSACLPPDRQGELMHRYVLGVYELLERLITQFPHLLLENCSGGGGRFDGGMLYYSPQIWCSDDTDAVERLAIQEGTALVYPLSCMGAHVSDCPNHALGRVTPFTTRGHVALAGTFGYELDITKISQADRDEIKEQTKLYHKYHPLVREGDYYRIASWHENHLYDCWQVVSKDRTETLVTYVQVLSQISFRSRRLRLQGLDPRGLYQLEDTDEIYSGEWLMNGGFLVQRPFGDFISRLYHFIKVG